VDGLGRPGPVPPSAGRRRHLLGSTSKARTQAINALKGLLVTAPAELREQLRDLSTVRLVQTAAALELGPVTTPLAAATLGVRSLACRYQALSTELTVLDAELDRLTAAAVPRLVAPFGSGRTRRGPAGGRRGQPRSAAL
jgi:transposase